MGPGSTQPNVTLPAGGSPAVSTPSAPPGQAHEDSINLVSLVGPALLKRVIPVAVAIAGLTLLGLRLRHALRRDAKS